MRHVFFLQQKPFRITALLSLTSKLRWIIMESLSICMQMSLIHYAKRPRKYFNTSFESRDLITTPLRTEQLTVRISSFRNMPSEINSALLLALLLVSCVCLLPDFNYVVREREIGIFGKGIL